MRTDEHGPGVSRWKLHVRDHDADDEYDVSGFLTGETVLDAMGLCVGAESALDGVEVVRVMIWR